MKLVITAATEFETRGIKEKIKSGVEGLQVTFHTSGVGILMSTYALTNLILQQKPDFIIQAGIAGCFHSTAELGSIVAVEHEFLGDTGVEENSGFNDIFDLHLHSANESPFQHKRLTNKWLAQYNLLSLPQVTSVTINEITTRPARIQILQEKFDPFIESMEGAPLHFVGLRNNVPFIQIRALSNYIGERDKSKWQIKSALTNLETTVLKYVDELYKFC